MPTAIKVVKNTATKRQTDKYHLVKKLIGSMIFCVYSNGTSGYEEFSTSARWMKELITYQDDGNTILEARITLDPSRMTPRHLQAIHSANQISKRWGFRSWDILDIIFEGKIFPRMRECAYSRKLSKASGKGHTSLQYVYQLNEVEKNDYIIPTGQIEIDNILTEYLTELRFEKAAHMAQLEKDFEGGEILLIDPELMSKSLREGVKLLPREEVVGFSKQVR